MRHLGTIAIFGAGALALAGGVAAAQSSKPSAAILAAVADPARPAADTMRDANRKPAETVAFAGVKPGDTVVELAPGRGYYTRILAKAVGPKGKVYAVNSPCPAARPTCLDALKAVAAGYPNVEVVASDYTMLTVPMPANLVWTTENYHDFHNGPTANIAALNKAVFSVLKPGGIFYVEDHSAPGTGVTTTGTLHRIDPQAAKDEVTAAGFKLEAESKHLANPADTHTDRVFDADINGKTDKFALRFRKPK